MLCERTQPGPSEALHDAFVPPGIVGMRALWSLTPMTMEGAIMKTHPNLTPPHPLSPTLTINSSCYCYPCEAVDGYSTSFRVGVVRACLFRNKLVGLMTRSIWHAFSWSVAPTPVPGGGGVAVKTPFLYVGKQCSLVRDAGSSCRRPTTGVWMSCGRLVCMWETRQEGRSKELLRR